MLSLIATVFLVSVAILFVARIIGKVASMYLTNKEDSGKWEAVSYKEWVKKNSR